MLDTDHLRREGWLRVANAVPRALCDRLVEVLDRELDVPLHDESRWDEYGGYMADLVPIWGHQAQWDIRQHPDMHRIWSTLWGTDALIVSLDSCRFTPPWRAGHTEPFAIHWDRDPRDAGRMLQSVLALTDTATDQGGFRCVPSLFSDRDAWPTRMTQDVDGDDAWLADIAGRDVVHVPARAGDLIVWDATLPHGNSKNLSGRPRLAFYILMRPADDPVWRADAIDSWRSGRCVPAWRDRPGYDHVEPWPPATLTPLGRRLIGLDAWA